MSCLSRRLIGLWPIPLLLFFLFTVFSQVIAAPTSLRPNPFDLIEEEAAKQFDTDKNSMTVGIAESPDFTPGAAVISNFTSFITPLLSNPAAGSGSIGPITSTCANINNIFIYQLNPIWKAVRAPNHPDYAGCTIGGCGCSSASTAMVLNSFGAGTDVITVWNQQHELNGYIYKIDSDTGKYYCTATLVANYEILPKAGLTMTYIGTGTDPADWEEAENFLNNCGLIIASGQCYFPEHVNPIGHVIVITGLVKNNSGQVTAIQTLDPGTHKGEGLIRPLTGTGDYAIKLSFMWGVTP